ncbi:glutathione synthetase [Vibrio methylphosphonaticus]|uniref:glutathione synthetase n=1 Tax=Vibrio methylphosphonaticus TaxID=2946866 RepID=UPI00202A7DE1|nr:glutathione synthetase [Vibrio methylphosphonaticus]MCL9775308.1 glutathione synthetase [Vibrio methylphosphonaticus]
MSITIPKFVVRETVERAMFEQLMFKQSKNTARHVPFTMTPVPIKRELFTHLTSTVGLFGKLLSSISEDYDFIKQSIEPVAQSDPFFRALLNMYEDIHAPSAEVLRTPLLILRTDFMDDEVNGPQIIEFNGIAAGMGPFGQKVHQLHDFVREQYSQLDDIRNAFSHGQLLENNAIKNLASGISQVAHELCFESGESRTPVFLTVIQEDEDNIFDQFLLESELRRMGVKTVRRTFRELHDQLSTGEDHRLHLQGIGHIDVVYFRAGYQCSDYVAHDLDEQSCCESLMKTRVFIEKHKVAVSATVSQHLAASKRVQMLLTQMGESELARFSLSPEESKQLLSVVGEMRPVDKDSVNVIASGSTEKWVLKNQGEGGGHCLFGGDIEAKLKQLTEEDYSAWALMERLYPKSRANPVATIKDGECVTVPHMISEIGMFTIHRRGEPLSSNNGYAGYLVRSKPSDALEGGVHSGLGVLDSLIAID